MQLLHLDQDRLGIPETNYACIVRMPSMKFARICLDLSQFGVEIVIACTANGEQVLNPIAFDINIQLYHLFLMQYFF